MTDHPTASERMAAGYVHTAWRGPDKHLWSQAAIVCGRPIVYRYDRTDESTHVVAIDPRWRRAGRWVVVVWGDMRVPDLLEGA